MDPLITGEEISLRLYMNGFFIDISPVSSLESLITDEEIVIKMFLLCICIISSSVIIPFPVSTGENQAHTCHQHAPHKISSSVTTTFSPGTGETLPSALPPCVYPAILIRSSICPHRMCRAALRLLHKAGEGSCKACTSGMRTP